MRAPNGGKGLIHMSDRSLASKLAERFLTGAVESIARAGAKAAESLAADTKKALETEAARAGGLENLIKAWRGYTLGDRDASSTNVAQEGKGQ